MRLQVHFQHFDRLLVVCGTCRTPFQSQNVIQFYDIGVDIRTFPLSTFSQTYKTEVVELPSKRSERRVIEVSRENLGFNLDAIMNDNSP